MRFKSQRQRKAVMAKLKGKKLYFRESSKNLPYRKGFILTDESYYGKKVWKDKKGNRYTINAYSQLIPIYGSLLPSKAIRITKKSETPIYRKNIKFYKSKKYKNLPKKSKIRLEKIREKELRMRVSRFLGEDTSAKIARKPPKKYGAKIGSDYYI